MKTTVFLAIVSSACSLASCHEQAVPHAAVADSKLETIREDGPGGLSKLSRQVRRLPDGNTVNHGIEVVEIYGKKYQLDWREGKPWTGTWVLSPGCVDMEFEYFREGKWTDAHGTPLDGAHYVWDAEAGRKVLKQLKDGEEVQKRSAEQPNEPDQ